MKRRSRRLFIGSVPVGGGAQVTVQSMTGTDTRNAAATLAQIRELYAAGCQIIRCAVPDAAAADALAEITAASPIPVVADIHFDYRLALRSLDSGAAEIRINPGNIGSADRVRRVAEACGEAGVPIRVGVNYGSVGAAVRARIAEGKISAAEGLVESALEQCLMLEKYGFTAIKVSLKASDVATTVEACRRFSSRSDCPLHLGVTEAGTPKNGVIKSAVGIGALLLDGVGDTIRVSLTAPPVEEVRAGLRILEAVGLRSAAPDLVACPTCGRTAIDLIGMAERVEAHIDRRRAAGGRFNLRKVAVMGCVVNGPGEAADADLGLAGGDGRIVIFKNGEVVANCPEAEGWERFRAELDSFLIEPPRDAPR